MAGSGWELPTRRVVVGSMIGALATGALLGLVLGILAPWGPGEGKLLAAAPGSSTASAAPTTEPAATSPTATASKTKAVRTVTKSPAAVPDQFIQQPEADRTLSLVLLQGIDVRDNRSRVVLRVTRARIISGDAARQFYQNQGQQPRNTAVVPVDNARQFDIGLRQDAALWGQLLLGDHQNVNLRQLRLDEFAQLTFDATNNRRESPPIWIKREYGSIGDVVYAAEHVAQ
jgi:hypothetical protein